MDKKWAERLMGIGVEGGEGFRWSFFVLYRWSFFVLYRRKILIKTFPFSLLTFPYF